MTQEQAWQLINNLVAQVKLTLQEHQQVQQAMALLKPEEKKAE